VAFDAFLKLTTASGQPVVGESTDKAHPGEILISGYNLAASHPVNQSSATGGAAAGKATFNDFTFTTPGTSKVTPILFQACAQGTRYNEAVVSIRRAGTAGGPATDYLKITMGTVFISSFSTGGGTGDAAPHDEVHLSYGRIQFSYTPQNPNGSPGAPVNGGWDVTKNAPA
jgi:type VI secretion system secreted protein Hcp